jgi:hypothetical protein
VKRKLLVAALAVVVVGVAIQLVPVTRANPPVVADLDAPREVKAVLKASCYDCHSNETRWPWYRRVAPVSWLVASDVKDARKRLDFSLWGTYEPAKQARLRDSIGEEVSTGEMPPLLYRVPHRQARLTDAARATLRAWIQPGP